ncbi:nuclear protein [Pyrenophora tritici-repentis]|nr:nuclear protein [Pyrenophora tritici-repentis]
MSQKRKHTETSEASSSAGKPFKKHRAFKPGQSNQKFKKRPHVSSEIDKRTSTNALKSRIRDLKRLLAHVDNVGDHKMSASNRVERERELEAIQHELKEKIESSREAAYRNKMIGKYHHVRFFDRQKGTRILKKLKKELQTEENESKKQDLVRRIHNAEVDVNYAIYYPLLKNYASLYPKSKKEKSSEEPEDEDIEDKSNREVDGPKGDVEMWRTVEEAMANGTLDALRNSKEAMPTAPAPVPKKQEKKKEHAVKSKNTKAEEKLAQAKNRRERRALGAQAQEEAEESDGGFFE